MNILSVLFLSIISVIFLLIGTIIVFKTKNSNKVMTFSVSLGFVVLILLGLLHLIPDAYEIFLEKYSIKTSIILILTFTIIGFLIILILDLFGGHHHEHEHEHKKNHYEHISIITCIFLVVHNFIEGMTIYSSVLISFNTALMLTLGIGLHNIPLGFTLSSTFNKNHSKSKTILFITFIGISYLFGSLFAHLFRDILMNSLVIGGTLTFTFGMVLYIAIFEFLPLIKESKQSSIRNIGFLVGIILMGLTLVL